MSEKEDVHVRISAEVMRPVREYAENHGISLAAAISIWLTQPGPTKEES
jgi:hypothetical protein